MLRHYNSSPCHAGLADPFRYDGRRNVVPFIQPGRFAFCGLGYQLGNTVFPGCQI